MKIFVTGGAGFIGSAFIRYLLSNYDNQILNYDKLSYAGNLNSLASISNNKNYSFIKGDICNKNHLSKSIINFKPDLVVHFAAETHVDRSINNPEEFINTNIIGTYNLLDESLKYWNKNFVKENTFRFHHISTDEVYGDLKKNEFFSEYTPYDPSSPYSASKASSDHLVRSWFRTFGLPITITNCSNNYGPYQYPEKLIPLMILNAIENKPLPIYGDGSQIRDWLHVDDHVRAIDLVLSKGKVGETYNVGGQNEKTNLDVVYTICDLLNELKIKKSSLQFSYRSLIEFVEDRPGHDKRYAIDNSKISKQLGWKQEESFESGLKKTIEWYLNNLSWCKEVQKGEFSRQRKGILKSNYK